METVTIESAAYEFVQQMVLRADGALDFGTSPFWHGWALRDAFLAGIAWERLRTSSTPQDGGASPQKDRRGTMLPRSARVVADELVSEQVVTSSAP